MRRLALIASLILFVGLNAVFAQTTTITGKVTDSESGEAIPGVSVVVRGTTIGTVTNVDGNYSLSVPDDATNLLFSFVGMKTKDVVIGGRTTINVVMESEAIGVDEVIVTALGISKEKKALGYAVTDVGADELEKAAESNVIQSLAGKVAGVQVVASAGTPGASSKIVIRGASTFSGNTQPLIVVDGIPINNETVQTTAGDYPFNQNLSGVNNSNRALDINPDDIASVTVLKGPAAAALYGTRAGNGVIIYTTKKGSARKGLGVNVSYSLEMNEVSQLPGLQYEYAQGNGGVYQTADPGPDERFFTDDDVDYGTSGSWGPKISDDPSLNAYNNVDKFFDTGISHNTNVSISGGNDVGTFRLSFGNTDQEGMIPNSSFQRNSVRITGDLKINDYLKIGGSANYVNSGGVKVQNGSNLAGIMLGLMRTPASFNLLPYKYDNGFQRTYFAFYDNPYYTANMNEFTDDVNRIVGNTFIEVKPMDRMRVTWKVGVDSYSDHRQQKFAVSSLGDDNSEATGQVNYNDLVFTQYYSDLVLNGDMDLTDDLNFTYTVGYNVTSSKYTDSYLRGRELAIPEFYNLSNATSLFASNYEEKVFTNALFGQLDFGYKNQLYLSLTGRNEWSSTFGADQRSFFYPSVTGSWLFSETLSLPSWLTYGKLRVAYAQVGIFPEPYLTKTYFTSPVITDGFTNGVSFPYGDVNGFGYSSTLGNATLKPERKVGTEFGLQLNFFQRVDVDFTYYDEKTKDILLFKPIAPSSGFTSDYTNAGELENKGIELQIGVDVIKNSDFNWEVIGNWSRNRNKVLKLADGVDQISIESAFTSIGSYAIVGEPVGVFYGTQWKRNDAGDLIIGSDGIPVKEDQEGNIGNPNPDWLGGLRNTFTYKGFTLSAMLDFRHGGDVYNGTFARLNNLGRTSLSADRERNYVIPGVKEDGSVNDISIPAVDYYKKYVGDAGGAAEQFVETVNWVRLRDISLTYSFIPKGKMSFVKNVELSATGRNLWLDTNYKGVDPETSLTGAGSNIGGFDYFNNPGSKSYIFGVKLSF